MIAFTSDLHLGITSEEALAKLAAEMRAAKPDALVLGGDIAEGPWPFERALEIFADVAPLRGYVAGNHDVWARQGWSSEQLLRKRLPEIARERGYDDLEACIWRIGSTAVVASMAWYDYSAIDPRLRGEDAGTIARRKREFVRDAERIDWPMSDVELAAELRAGVERRLVEADADGAIERIVVCTHVPIFEEQIERRPHDDGCSYSNAYFGHLTLGEVVARFAKVSDVVSGHTHCAREAAVRPAAGRPIRACVNGSEYGRPLWCRIP